MVELFDREKRDINRKSSKGNQLKWERNGIWYKADYTGYEGLAEYVVSSLLRQSTLADITMDYPLNRDTYELLREVKAKTFCEDFEEQLEIAERLYGNCLRFSFDKKDVEEIMARAFGYDKKVIDRVKDIVFEQMRRYLYLF